jgi:hypothetical protein
MVDDVTSVLELICGDDAAAWAALGFAGTDVITIGGAAIRLTGEGGGLRSWRLSPDGGPAVAAHPNGAVSIDHVVLMTDDREASVADLAARGGDVRRRADPPGVPVPMAFVRVGGVVFEVAQGGGPPRLWGVTFVVDDLDGLAERLGDRLGPVRAALQPGRRIATVRPQPGLETAVAFMTPRVRAHRTARQTPVRAVPSSD